MMKFLCVYLQEQQKNQHMIMDQKHLIGYEKRNIYNGVYYAFNTKMTDYQEYLRQTTADEYKKRNLMLGEGVLTRY